MTEPQPARRPGTARPPSAALPILHAAPDHGRSAPPRSTRGRWRALVLLAVYALAAAHYLHWRLAGRTVTPVEPSEGMQTLEQGLVNAGFIFFGLALLSTLVLGRWFCGWGCHLVALQDLCTWLLRKAGLRPRPFRSRLLAFVPLAAGLYMFAWPTVHRVLAGQPRPEWELHLTTADYWATFPGVAVALLTFAVCGFLIVYLLGNKGFCTYACPYGGLFGVVDRLAPGRIRVTDACRGCGHCTAVCTSNVRVHEEVRQYGMVVDPGCMKCTDCVSACPSDALYFGFGQPALFRGRPRHQRRPRTFEYTWREELALAVVFAAALFSLRGLYDAVPFLLSLGAGAIAAFLLVEAGRVLYGPARQRHGLTLRSARRPAPAGIALLALAAVLGGFLVHSGLVQVHEQQARRALERATAAADPAAVRDATLAAREHLQWLRRWGLLATARTEARLGATALYLDRLDEAEPHLRRALELQPRYGAARHKWAELQARRGDLDGGIDELLRAVRDDPTLADARRDLIAAAGRTGRLPEVVTLLEQVLARGTASRATRASIGRDLDLARSLSPRASPEAPAR